MACIERGSIRATVDTPKVSKAKRSKSQKGAVEMEYELMNRSVTPQNKRVNYNSFYN